MSYFRRIIRDSVDTSVKFPGPHVSHIGVSNIALRDLNNMMFPHYNSSSFSLFRFIPRSYLDEFRSFRYSMEKNLDRFYLLGKDFHSFGVSTLQSMKGRGKMLGAVVVVGSVYMVSSAVWRRISKCNGHYCGWIHSVDSFLTNTFRVKRRALESDQAFKIQAMRFLQKGQFLEVKFTLDAMLEKGYIPDEHFINLVIETFLSEFEVRLASKILKNLLELGVAHMSIDLTFRILKSLLLRGQVGKLIQHTELLLQNDKMLNFNDMLSSVCDPLRVIPCFKFVMYLLDSRYKPSAEICARVFDTLIIVSEPLHGYSIFCKAHIKRIMRWDETRRLKLIECLNEKGCTGEAESVMRMRM